MPVNAAVNREGYLISPGITTRELLLAAVERDPAAELLELAPKYLAERDLALAAVLC